MKTVVIAVAALALVSCGWEDKKEKVKEGAGNLQKAEELMREWESSCQTGVLNTLSGKYKFEFAVVDFKRVLRAGTGADCSNLDIEITYRGSFEIRDQSEAQKSDGVKPINLRYNTVVVKPLTEGGRDFLKSINFCGKSDWAREQEVDLTGSATSDLCPLADVPQEQFEIFKVDGEYLRFGASSAFNMAPTDESKRPTKLDEFSYKKTD